MRFQVPQFIEHEAKVIGPFTFRQSVYLGVPGAVAFFLYFLAPFFVFVVVAILLGASGFMFAFIKIQGRSLPTIIMNFLHFTITAKRYIWKKGKAPIETAQTQYQQQPPQQQPAKREIKLIQKSKIKDLATRVDTTR